MKKEKIYEGGSKTLYSSKEEDTLIMSFNDNIILDSGEIIEVSGKGAVCNTISAYLMEKLDLIGIENHFIKKNNMHQQKVQFVDIYPIQIRVTNVACDKYVKDFGIEEGLVFETPIIDFRIKNKLLNYPVINEHQIYNFRLASKYEIKELKKAALRIHDFLAGIFAGVGIRFVECNLEFGRVFNGEEIIIMLADEISPNTCRLWDMETNQKLSFELINTNPEMVREAYSSVCKRLGAK